MTDKYDRSAAQDASSSADRPPLVDQPRDDEGSLVYLVLICFVATLGGLLFGYDTAVIADAILYLKPYFGLSAAMEGWLAACALAGCAVGAMLAGLLSDYLGRKKVLILCAVLFVISAIGTALPQSRWVFVLFRALGGVGIGAASMTSPMYIAEVSPARIRGRMVSLNQLAIMFGMLAVYFVNYAIAGLGDEHWNELYGWRWMFASGAFPALALLLLLCFVPESPRWLVKQGARGRGLPRVVASQRFARGKHGDCHRSRTQCVMRANRSGSCLRRACAWLLVIGVVLAVLQQITGINVFLYFAPKILRGVAGAQANVAMLQTIMVGVVNLAFTVVAIWTVDRLGRKPLMIFGYVGMGISLLVLGLVAQSEKDGDVGAAAHPHLYRVVCRVRRPGDMGHSVRDFPHEDPRPGHGDRHGLLVDCQPRRVADLSHDDG